MGAGAATAVACAASPVVRISPLDNVAVAVEPVAAGAEVCVAGGTVRAVCEIPRGHKMALAPIACGSPVVKYGCSIGHATRDIEAGEWVHEHNMATDLSGEKAYVYHPRPCDLPREAPQTFMGYRRPDGRAAVRNEVWVVPTVGCVNEVARAIAARGEALAGEGVDGVVALCHPYGCSQTGADHAQTRRLLAALCRHPNAAGVLVLSLGCENLTHEQFVAELGDYDPARVRFLTCQDVEDEVEEGTAVVAELVRAASRAKREPIPVSELVVGLKCGGSDGLSGITANPAIGSMSDRVVAQGGTALLAEVPEMFGAESLLLDRCRNEGVFDEACRLLNGFKDYFVSHGEVVYENPSPGNRAGGITTLEDKSCGCVQKGGTAPIEGVVPYGGQVRRRGLNLLCSPGNDLVSATALAAAGAHVVVFSTGRGTPFGCAVPTVKVASNTAIYERKRRWFDFNAGVVADGRESVADAGCALFDRVLAVASGALVAAERLGSAEIAIWKDGVTL